jgi:hypothetical protein
MTLSNESVERAISGQVDWMGSGGRGDLRASEPANNQLAVRPDSPVALYVPFRLTIGRRSFIDSNGNGNGNGAVMCIADSRSLTCRLILPDDNCN